MRLKARLTQDSRISTMPSNGQRALNLNIVVPEEAQYVPRPSTKEGQTWISSGGETVYFQRSMFINVAQYLNSEDEVKLVDVLKKGSEIQVEGQIYATAYVPNGEEEKTAKEARLSASLNMRIKGFKPLDQGTKKRFEAYLRGDLPQTSKKTTPSTTASPDEECE